MPEELPRVPFRPVMNPCRRPSHDPKLCDYWKWSSSDLLSNTLRGVLAEYLVVTALRQASRRMG